MCDCANCRAGGETYSAEFRHAAEIRHCANLPSDTARRQYLAGVCEKRGKVAWQRLRFDVWKEMERVA